MFYYSSLDADFAPTSASKRAAPSATPSRRSSSASVSAKPVTINLDDDDDDDDDDEEEVIEKVCQFFLYHPS